MDRPMVVTHDHIILKRNVVVYFVVACAVLLAALACTMSGTQQPAASAQPAVVTVVVTQPGQATCGDGVCTAPEDASTCPADCAAGSAATVAAEPSGAKVKTTQEIRVRFGPSTNCAVIGSYPKDTEVGVLAKDPTGKWWQVPIGSDIGWMSVAYTTPVTDLSAVPELAGPYCAPPPTETPVPPTLTPAPVCGNGIVEAGEECDTADTCSGILICGSNCKCKSPLLPVTILPHITLKPVAVCGNGIVEAGEECDGAGTCGTFQACNSSCQCKSLLHIVTLEP